MDHSRARGRHRARPRDQALRRLRRRPRRQLRHRAGRVLLDARPVGLRQDDDAADDRRVRAADARAGSCSTARTCPRIAALPAQRQHRLPAVRAVPAHVGVRQRRLRPAQPEGRQGRDRHAGCGEMLEIVRLGDFASRKPGPALGRPAAARRAGPGARQPAERRCCSTSRSARSTSSCARPCSSSSSASSARSASPSCSSPTTRRRRSR